MRDFEAAIAVWRDSAAVGKGLGLLAYKHEIMLHIALNHVASLQDYPERLLRDKWMLERLCSKTVQKENYKIDTSWSLHQIGGLELSFWPSNIYDKYTIFSHNASFLRVVTPICLLWLLLL